MSAYSKAKEREDHIKNNWWTCPTCGQTVPTVNKDIHLDRHQRVRIAMPEKYKSLGLECICTHCHNIQRVRLRRGTKVRETPCTQCNTKNLMRKYDYDNGVASGRIHP
jgi:hypothetical protein